MKVKDLVLKLEAWGWQLNRIRGSHHVFTHPKAQRSITVPVHGKDIGDHFAQRILNQAKKATTE
jgi:predicted RNA binding protein YcfA (HicA-like mRNA interferase family)